MKHNSNPLTWAQKKTPKNIMKLSNENQVLRALVSILSLCVFKFDYF